VPVGQGPRGLAVDPGANRAYVVNTWSNDVSLIDIATNTVVGVVPVGRAPWSVTVSSVSGRIYVADTWDSTISLIDGVSR
jgi:YVTN family beta-propeller protein